MPKFQNYMYTEVTVNLQVAFRKKIVPVPLVFIETSENYNSLKGKWHNEIWKMTIVCDYCENGIRHHMILGSDLGKLSREIMPEVGWWATQGNGVHHNLWSKDANIWICCSLNSKQYQLLQITVSTNCTLLLAHSHTDRMVCLKSSFKMTTKHLISMSV